MTAEDRIQPEVLLQHRAFVRRVSRALVADPHLALDLEQEAWLAAIEHPPRRVEALLRLFRVAIRNIASKRRRGDSRRTGRERRAARPEATDATDAIVHRLAVQREVVDAVLALERHYRAVIVLRYYEDLGPAAISARLALPLRTVKFRLQRAVELLRSRLGEHDRHDWFRSGLLALAGAPQASLVPATAGVTGAAGVTIMGAKVSVGMLCASALSSVAVWLGSELLKDEGLQGGTTAMPPPAASTPGIRGETRDGNAVGREVVMGAVPAALAAEQPPPGGEGDAAALPATGAVTLSSCRTR
ncbi:MAG: sigma-70 family RNA polymerase sigma factor [Planctomycetota bacterium]